MKKRKDLFKKDLNRCQVNKECRENGQNNVEFASEKFGKIEENGCARKKNENQKNQKK